jgi:hypothetical protein
MGCPVSTVNTFPWPDFDSWALAPENWVPLGCRCTEGDQCVHCQAYESYSRQNGDPLGLHDAARAYLVGLVAMQVLQEDPTLTVEQANAKAERDVDVDDAIAISDEPCAIPVKFDCGRTDLHGHSGFEQGFPGGDGDWFDWYVPAFKTGT